MALRIYYALSAVLLLVILIARRVAHSLAASRFKKEHGCKPGVLMPQRERIIGYDLFMMRMRRAKEKKLLEMGREFYRVHGTTWSATTMGETFVNTIDPENIKAVLATNFKDFGIGQRVIAFGPLLGEGIFTTDGAQWEHSRSLVRPNFTRAQVADLDTFETHIQQLIYRIPRDGSTVDLQTLFFQLTLDSATEFLFGESVYSLSSTEGSEQQQFGTAFDFAQKKMGTRSRLGPFVYFHRDPEFTNACRTVHEFVDKIVYKALNATSPGVHEKFIDGKGGSDRYVFLTEMARATRNPKQLRDELLNILLAGRDTTASLLSNTFHVLARRPDIWKNLQAEVDELNGEKPEYETLRNMKYLKFVLNESLRLYPVVPGNARFANKATTIPRGGGPDGQSPLYIAKGQVVVYSVNAMHRRKDIYGPDANEFRPERWGPEENLRPGWGYLPFNGGPRICVGQQFALTEASYTIVRLLQEFSGIEDRDGQPWREQIGLTLASDNGVKVAMIPK